MEEEIRSIRSPKKEENRIQSKKIKNWVLENVEQVLRFFFFFRWKKTSMQITWSDSVILLIKKELFRKNKRSTWFPKLFLGTIFIL